MASRNKGKAASPKAAPTTNKVEPNKNRYNNGHRAYPLPDTKLVLVGDCPARGKDQRLRWDECKAAEAAAKKARKPFTAGWLAEHAPGGRRTLRRAQRMGAFVGWNALGPVDTK